MPAISPHDRILVTGANGYIGLWAVHRLLQTGYRVRAAVRTEDKAAALVKLFAAKLPDVAHNLECTIVGNIIAVCCPRSLRVVSLKRLRRTMLTIMPFEALQGRYT